MIFIVFRYIYILSWISYKWILKKLSNYNIFILVAQSFKLHLNLLYEIRVVLMLNWINNKFCTKFLSAFFCIGANRKKKDFQTSCLNEAVVDCEWAGDEEEYYRLRSVQRNTQGKCSERKSERIRYSLFRKMWLRHHYPVIHHHRHHHHGSLKCWRRLGFYSLGGGYAKSLNIFKYLQFVQ